MGHEQRTSFEELLTHASSDAVRILFANERAERLFGHSREQLLGQPAQR